MLYQISSYACKLIAVESHSRKSNEINLLQLQTLWFQLKLKQLL